VGVDVGDGVAVITKSVGNDVGVGVATGGCPPPQAATRLAASKKTEVMRRIFFIFYPSFKIEKID
jgi:hypothetical protein